MQQTSSQPISRSNGLGRSLYIRLGIMCVVLFLLLGRLVAWGGSASSGPLLFVGVAAIGVLFLAFSGLIWWLYFSPLLAPTSSTSVSNPALRQAVALLACLAGAGFVVGGFWDELWHRKFGGFGNDFLWPPHLMLYGSIATIMLFAGGGLVLVLRGQGSLRQRVRADPMVGLLALCASYMVASLPSDALWHKIYGIDLSAWSLPHVIIVVAFTFVMLAGVGVQRSALSNYSWRVRGRVEWREWIIIGCLAWALLALLQIGVSEWQGLTASAAFEYHDAFQSAFWHRPQWLYPVVIATIVPMIGTIALYSLKRIGSATLVALTALTARLLCLWLFGTGSGMDAWAHLIAVGGMIMLDLWCAPRASHMYDRRTILCASALTGATVVLITMAVIRFEFVYPPLTTYTVPRMIVIGVGMAMLTGWLGQQVATVLVAQSSLHAGSIAA